MRTFGIAAFVAFLIDQISKYVVIHMMELARVRSIDVLPPVLNFRYGENRGINFGLGGDMSQWVLIAVALASCAGVTVPFAYGSSMRKMRRASPSSSSPRLSAVLASVCRKFSRLTMMDDAVASSPSSFQACSALSLIHI